MRTNKRALEEIKNEFECEPRGAVDVKDKEETKVWLVLSAKEKILLQGV